MMDAWSNWNGVGPLYWREPLWLWASALPLLWWLISRWRRKQHWQKVTSPELQPWLQVQSGAMAALKEGAGCPWRVVMASLGWVLICVAMAGPRIPSTSTHQALLPADQVLLLVDRSRSMAARDTRFDRQQQAQRIIRQWVSKEEDVDWGLVLFAGHAHRIAAVTTDRGFIHQRVDALLGLPLPTLGNDLAGALREAQSAFASAKPKAPRHIVLFSDGDLETAEKQAAEAEVRHLSEMSPAPTLHVMGLGGHRAVPIPQSGGGWLEQGGEMILSQRDQVWLTRLAGLAKGHYYAVETLSDQKGGIRESLGLSQRRLPDSDLQDVVWVEGFPLPLILGALMLFLALLSRQDRSPGTAGSSVLVLLICTGFLVAPDSSQADVRPQAEEALAQQDWAAARDRYRDLEGYAARFGEGVACYRLKDWTCSTEAWSRAVMLAAAEDQRQDRLRAIFNLGNTYFRMGRFDEAQVLFEDLLAQWPDAVEIALMRGLSRDQVETNLTYARDLAAAVERERADRRKALRRVAFKARAGLLQGRGQDGSNVASGMGSDFANDLADTNRAMIRRALQGMNPDLLATLDIDLGQDSPGKMAGENGGVAEQDFNRTAFGDQTGDQTGQGSDDQAGLIWKRLLEMEVGIPAALEQPRPVQGKRPW